MVSVDDTEQVAQPTPDAPSWSRKATECAVFYRNFSDFDPVFEHQSCHCRWWHVATFSERLDKLLVELAASVYAESGKWIRKDVPRHQTEKSREYECAAPAD